MDASAQTRSGSTSPFPIIVNSETLFDESTDAACKECSQLAQAIKHAFIQQAAKSSVHIPSNGCIEKNRLILHLPQYKQKLKWYYECSYCDYKSFYTKEIESHTNIKHLDFSASRPTDIPAGEIPVVCEALDQPCLSLAELDTPKQQRSTKPAFVPLTPSKAARAVVYDAENIALDDPPDMQLLITSNDAKTKVKRGRKPKHSKVQNTENGLGDAPTISGEGLGDAPTTSDKGLGDIPTISETESLKQKQSINKIDKNPKIPNALSLIIDRDGVVKRSSASALVAPPVTAGVQMVAKLASHSVAQISKSASSLGETYILVLSSSDLSSPKRIAIKPNADLTHVSQMANRNKSSPPEEISSSVISVTSHRPPRPARAAKAAKAPKKAKAAKHRKKGTTGGALPSPVKPLTLLADESDSTKADNPLVSPIRTINLSQFSDVLGLKQINGVEKAPADLTAKATMDLNKTSDKNSVNLKYQRVYKTTGKRSKEKDLAAKYDPASKSATKPTLCRDTVVITPPVPSNSQTSITLSSDSSKGIRSLDVTQSSSSLELITFFDSSSTPPITNSTPAPSSEQIPAHSILETAANTTTTLRDHQYHKAALTSQTESGSSPAVPSVEGKPHTPSNVNSSDTKSSVSMQSQLTLSLTPLEMLSEKILPRSLLPSGLRKQLAVKSTARGLRRTARKSTGGKLLLSKHKTKSQASKDTAGGKTAAGESQDIPKAVAIRSIFSLTKDDRPDASSGATSLTIPLPRGNISDSLEARATNAAKSLADTCWHSPDTHVNSSTQQPPTTRVTSTPSAPSTIDSDTVNAKPQASLVLSSALLSPLHITTDLPRRPLVESAESDSPAEDESNPWPSPLDPPSQDTSMLSPDATVDKSGPLAEEGCTGIMTTPKPPLPLPKSIDTPLLTIGRSTATPPNDLSPAMSTSSKTSVRLSISSSRRITKDSAVFALTALRPSFTPPRPLFNPYPVHSSAVMYQSSRVAHLVYHVHDKRTKVVKHFCKHKPIEIIDESFLGSDEMDEANAWPGPLLSDEEGKDQPMSPDSLGSDVDDGESDGSIPPLHPRWSCSAGCKYHSSPSPSYSTPSKRNLADLNAASETDEKRFKPGEAGDMATERADASAPLPPSFVNDVSRNLDVGAGGDAARSLEAPLRHSPALSVCSVRTRSSRI